MLLNFPKNYLEEGKDLIEDIKFSLRQSSYSIHVN